MAENLTNYTKAKDFFNSLSDDFKKSLIGLTQYSEHGFAVISEDLVVIYANKAMFELTELPEEKLIGGTVREVMSSLLPSNSSKSDVPVFESFFSDIIVGKNNDIWLNKNKLMKVTLPVSGKFKMFKARTSFLESAGHPFALSTFEDITERYIDFEGGIIAKQSSCFDPFLNTFTPTVILDERHVVLKINDAFQNNYGWKQENLRGKTLFDSNVVEVNDSLKSFIKTMNVKNFSKIYYGNIFTSKQQ